MSHPESDAAPNKLMNAYMPHQKQKVISHKKKHDEAQRCQDGRSKREGRKEKRFWEPFLKSYKKGRGKVGGRD